VNKLEKILGVPFPNKTIIINATNTTNKVKKNSIFFGLQGTQVHGSKYIEKALDLGASIAVHDDPNFKSNLKNIFYVKPFDNGPIDGDFVKKSCMFFRQAL
jgi:UDP-N-acetylmuramyl tripeptide synthase